ncbi:MAG: hypothetical protein JWP94_2957 [Mucilaginibacter sp.]|nr:hypothetical protein [Mucilaginibacter sp.]
MLQLYRSDQRGRKTVPEKFNTFGIASKQLNSGDDPEPFKKYGWIRTITAHIHVKAPCEQFIYDTTHYLSFTTDKAQAMVYLAGSAKRSFVHCNRDEAEAYLFTLNINPTEMSLLQKGVYRYTFFCNYLRREADPKFSGFLQSLISCDICSNYPGYTHQLLLIDASTYLEDLSTEYPEAYANANRDSEWLVMPADPVIGPNAKGFQSRIPIADFWNVSFFRYL